MPGQAGPDGVWRAVEMQRHQTRMIEQALDGRPKRAEGEPIARQKARRQ
jgi:hypothetical protein